MRIAIVTDWFPPRRGGIEVQLAQLSTRLADRGHDVDVITSTPHATNGGPFRLRSLSHLTVPRLDLALSPRIAGSLRTELARNYDVVHTHVSVVSPLAYASIAVGQSLGLPMVVTFHSVLRLKRLMLRTLDALVGIADRPIVWTGVSELIASQLRVALAGADVGVLPNGIDLGFWRATEPPAPRDRAGAVTLVSATRLHRKKRPMQLIAAFANAAARARVPATLVLAGDGAERRTLERAIQERGLATGNVRVELAGWQSVDALRSLYSSADAFVLASTREAFGIAALEAAAAGVPVIAMSASGCREFVGGVAGSHLCADDAELVRALTRVLSAPRRAGRMGTEHLGRYDWHAVLDAHDQAYARAIRRTTLASQPV